MSVNDKEVRKAGNFLMLWKTDQQDAMRTINVDNFRERAI